MGVTFTRDAAKRIATAVRWVEGQKPSRAGQQLTGVPMAADVWGFITGSGFDGNGKTLYSFVRVIPDNDDPDIRFDMKQAWKLVEPVISHYQCAIEVNGHGVPSNTIVKLSFTGYRDFPEGERRAMFAFSHTPTRIEPFLPIHDHRDNTAGGFSFAVWHPGTSLPQRATFP